MEEIVRVAEREAAVIQRDLAAHRAEAEREARRYVDDARREADALVRRRVGRLRELTDELVEQAEAAQRQLDSLAGVLQRSTARLEGEDREKPAASSDGGDLGGSAGGVDGEALSRSTAGVEGDDLSRSRPGGDDGPRAPARRQRLPRGQRRPQLPLRVRAALRTPDEIRGKPPSPSSQERRTSAASGGPSALATAPDLEAARLVAVEMAVAGSSRDEVERHLRDAFGIRETHGLLDDVFGAGDQESPSPSPASF